VTYSDLPRLVSMAAVWLLMLTWQFNAGRIGCPAALALLGVFTLLILLSGAETGLARRRILLRECIDARGRLHRVLSRRFILVVLQVLKSAGLAVFLFVGALGFTGRQWSLLFADALLTVLLLPRFYLLFKDQVREDYRYAMARRWTVWASTLLLWSAAMLVLLYSTTQNYMGLRWQEVMTFAGPAPAVQCGPLQDLGALAAAVEALGHWSVQNLARNLQDPPQALVAFVSLLAAAGFALVLAYAYSRALLGAVARPWAMWRIPPNTPD
jgi:hypothetical protein